MGRKISVIVPVYNCEKYLEKCVNSIVKQKHNDLEIILVNDGSLDKSGEICDYLLNRDSRIRVLHQKNSGVSNARNEGIKIATGDYITFVDADDYLENDYIYSEAVNIAETENVDVVAWIWQYEDSKGNLVVSKNKILGIDYGKQSARKFLRGLYQGNYANVTVVAVWNKLYRKSVISENKFVTLYSEDEKWSVQLLSEISNLYVLDVFGYVYKENKKSLTSLPFTSENYSIFTILEDRCKLLSDDLYLVSETQKLYCNLYIEYYYKAIKTGIIPYSNNKVYKKFKGGNPKFNIKTKVRFTIFAISPWLYQKLVWKR